jgi:hypothetical protein
MGSRQTPIGSLPAAGEDQVNAIGLGLGRTDAYEPTIVRSITCDEGANEQRHEERQKEETHLRSAIVTLCLTCYRRKPDKSWGASNYASVI